MIEPKQEGAIHKHWLTGISLAALLAANGRPEVRTPLTASDELRITIYDQAHLPREVIFDAMNRLRLILRQAKIAGAPVLGNPANPEASLFLYVALPSKGEDPRLACRPRQDIALKIIDSSPDSLPQAVLGMSSPFAASGHNVRLFNDHIHEAALRHGLPHAIVLSYAMAHEIGHVLLLSHGQTGIMSSVWTVREYQHMAAGVLRFSDGESNTMSANLRAPLCHNMADHNDSITVESR
jgi:hypothetical protein